MGGRAVLSSSFAVLFSLAGIAALPSAAWAQEESAPAGEADRAPPSPPKLLGAGKGADGTHAFLFARRGGPTTVFLGQPGNMRELDVLGVERFPGVFVVDTLELGTIKFNTTERSVIIPGDVGFIQRRPTRVMRQAPDKAAFVEALGKMGVGVRSPTDQPGQTRAITSTGARPRVLPATSKDSRLRAFTSTKVTNKLKQQRTLRKRPTARTRPTPTGRAPQAKSGRRAPAVR